MFPADKFKTASKTIIIPKTIVDKIKYFPETLSVVRKIAGKKE